MTFDNTLAALAAYDRGEASRAKRWADAKTTADVDSAVSADLVALHLVREAFHQDTHSINSYAACMVADLAFMRRVAKGSK